MDHEQNIPVQQEGGKSDVTESITLDSVAAAKQFFRIACQKLRDVNKWHEVCNSEATKFTLVDRDGNATFRDAEEGDYFKINIPGPGNSAGDGFDWVRVEEMSLKEDGVEDVFFIRVRPAEPPIKNEHGIAHFFKDRATSTFMIRRKDNTVRAEVHGRNEKPNVDTAQIKDKIRNAVVGTASLLGFSLPQWKMLVKGLVKTD
jgi:hypothetical protein